MDEIRTDAFAVRRAGGDVEIEYPDGKRFRMTPAAATTFAYALDSAVIRAQFNDITRGIREEDA